jgi:hypothetical protein
MGVKAIQKKKQKQKTKNKENIKDKSLSGNGLPNQPTHIV